MAAAAAAAAAKKRQDQEEEEMMTRYTHDELESGWEFKIVRSASGAFGKQETLRKLMEEEARAGWVMVEKFDNSRIRFKRAPGAKEGDRALPAGVDPYRTEYGMSEGVMALLVIGGILGSMAVIGLLVAAFS